MGVRRNVNTFSVTFLWSGMFVYQELLSIILRLNSDSTKEKHEYIFGHKFFVFKNVILVYHELLSIILRLNSDST